MTYSMLWWAESRARYVLGTVAARRAGRRPRGGADPRAVGGAGGADRLRIAYPQLHIRRVPAAQVRAAAAAVRGVWRARRDADRVRVAAPAAAGARRPGGGAA